MSPHPTPYTPHPSLLPFVGEVNCGDRSNPIHWTGICCFVTGGSFPGP
ncbi:MAG: hypothetical protein F6J93_21220 [Oscillatoria sp. SIO1A7]|nr:hypothetical protein [Oscillatoria sp. SIO1A7]